MPPKKTLKNIDLLNSKDNFRSSLSFPSLADYYIKELVIEAPTQQNINLVF